MTALDPDQSLRLDSRSPVRVTCLFGVLWVTTPGDWVDRFLSRGESLTLDRPAGTLVAGLTPAVVSVQSLSGAPVIGRLLRRLSAAWLTLGTPRADNAP